MKELHPFVLKQRPVSRKNMGLTRNMSFFKWCCVLCCEFVPGTVARVTYLLTPDTYGSKGVLLDLHSRSALSFVASERERGREGVERIGSCFRKKKRERKGSKSTIRHSCACRTNDMTEWRYQKRPPGVARLSRRHHIAHVSSPVPGSGFPTVFSSRSVALIFAWSAFHVARSDWAGGGGAGLLRPDPAPGG